jgi:hypothetical protein
VVVAKSQQYNVSSGMEEVPPQNMPIQRLKAAVIQLDIACSGQVNHSVEILTTGNAHKKPDYSQRMTWE